MIHTIRFFPTLCFFVLLLNTGSFAQEQPESLPSILSPDLSGVNYVQKSEQDWTLIIADREGVYRVQIDGEDQKIEKKKTVVIKKHVRFKKGQNTYTVEVENSQGLLAKRTFTVYYSDDPADLEKFRIENLPAEKRPFASFVTIAAGARIDSNAAHLSEDLSPNPTYNDRQASARSGALTLGYRAKPEGSSRTFLLQYSYFTEAYDDKQLNDAELSDLGLHSHTISAQYTLTQTAQAWGLVYAWSQFNGNAKTDEGDESTSDNGSKASFHFLVPTYTRVHNKSLSSMVLIKLISRSFEEEPEDADQDRDSALSAGIDYNLFYYLPGKMGRFKGLLSFYNDQAEGKAQRYTQKEAGLDYSKSWDFERSESELRWQLAVNGRSSEYAEKYVSVVDSSVPEDRTTTRESGQMTLSWIYRSSLTIQAGYSQIRDYSSIEEFNFHSEVRSLNLSWHSFF
ncbi:MAG: hypothetical protein HQM13_00180 [SAR324 cluster bacterium]|nr:hypothetical protein [SAR324 cluster bacterium]